ncbi:MAG: carotenoid biosynthesis protein [Sphaerochaetaceae bacterium]|nr:carotenoid biosynthesis protein [Sphaerochaetaceae bacterium]
MLQTFEVKKHLIFILLPIFYAMGVLWHALEFTLPYMLIITPYTILITTIIGFYAELRNLSGQLLLWALSTFLITFTLEAVGVATGDVFGSYRYGPTLGFSLFGVPLLIGLNWTLIIFGFNILYQRWFPSRIAVILLVAFSTVVFDWVLEPVAISYDYWKWQGNTIPLQNYAAWFAISLVFSAAFQLMRIKPRSIMPSFVVLVEFVFFLLLRIFVI